MIFKYLAKKKKKKYPQYLGEYVDEHNCYSTKLHRDTYKAEPRFYFGGPGQNPLCP